MAANPDFVYQPPMFPYLDIIYRDKDLIVLNKPSGLLTVPGRLPEHRDCLQTRVQRVLPSATIVHRLDMATSGVMLMALNKRSHAFICKQFEKRITSKHYIARVYGQPSDDQGEVNLPLICDWPNRPKQKVDFEHGKSAKTLWQVLSRDGQSSLLKLMPITGRSHQLRVHMLSLDMPIVGDKLYAHASALALSPRLLLHAEQISLYHPKTNEKLTFTAPCPFS